MPDPTILIVSEEDDLYSVYSPTLPGFVYGATGEKKFFDGLRSAVTWAGGTDPVLFYRERGFVTPEGAEVLLRFPVDVDLNARVEVAHRVEAALATDQRHAMLADLTPIVTEEYVFHCALFTDTVRSITAAMSGDGDSAAVAVSVADEMVYVTPISLGGTNGESLETLGLSLDSTVRDLFDAETQTSTGHVSRGAMVRV